MDFLRTLTLIPSNLDWSVIWRSKASYTLALASPCLAILSPATMQSWQCVSEWGLPIHRQQTTQQARSIGDSSRKSTTRAHKCLHGCSRSNGLTRQTLYTKHYKQCRLWQREGAWSGCFPAKIWQGSCWQVTKMRILQQEHWGLELTFADWWNWNRQHHKVEMLHALLWDCYRMLQLSSRC